LHWIGALFVVASIGSASAEKTQPVKPKAPEEKAPKPKAPKVPKKPRKPKEPKVDVLTLTADPKLAKADRIEGEELRGYVAFTFDDGPSPQTTPAVIDALEKYNVPATFFIVSQRLLGKYGEKSRAILQRLVKGGFTIASHSYSHPNLRGSNATKLTLEIDDAIRILARESGKMIGLFRAPFGALDAASRGWLKKRGLTEAFWSVDTLDWKARDSERLRKKTIGMIVKQEGGVVLLHDVKPITAKITALVLDDLEAENCKRLADKKLEPILPVSIHYFIRDKKVQRPIPDEVKKQTDAYRAALPGRCAKRPPPPETKPDPAVKKSPPTKSDKPAEPKKP
jgi:peptidoglycan/xylan/chitin deacetylase (PgdA/CDA1 family)